MWIALGSFFRWNSPIGIFWDYVSNILTTHFWLWQLFYNGPCQWVKQRKNSPFHLGLKSIRLSQSFLLFHAKHAPCSRTRPVLSEWLHGGPFVMLRDSSCRGYLALLLMAFILTDETPFSIYVYESNLEEKESRILLQPFRVEVCHRFTVDCKVCELSVVSQVHKELRKKEEWLVFLEIKSGSKLLHSTPPRFSSPLFPPHFYITTYTGSTAWISLKVRIQPKSFFSFLHVSSSHSPLIRTQSSEFGLYFQILLVPFQSQKILFQKNVYNIHLWISLGSHQNFVENSIKDTFIALKMMQ